MYGSSFLSFFLCFDRLIRAPSLLFRSFCFSFCSGVRRYSRLLALNSSSFFHFSRVNAFEQSLHQDCSPDLVRRLGPNASDGFNTLHFEQVFTEAPFRGDSVRVYQISKYFVRLCEALPSHPVTKRHASSDSGSAVTWESQIRDRRSAVRFALGSWLAVARRSRRTHLVTAFLVRRDDEPVAAPLLLVV